MCVKIRKNIPVKYVSSLNIIYLYNILKISKVPKIPNRSLRRLLTIDQIIFLNSTILKSTTLKAIILTLILSLNSYAADIRFKSNYPCKDTNKTCLSSGKRIVDGFEVHKDCWEFAYTKTCNYPSKDDCAKYAKCYLLGRSDCLLRDSLGNCVNIKKEFSCKRWEPIVIKSENLRYGTKDIAGPKALVCEGIPCIDGNCIDKSYELDSDMISSISKLAALSKGKSDGVNFKIFEGVSSNCSKKPMNYHNCCQVHPKGWGKKLLGAKCTKEEQVLSEKRSSNLCIYVGKSTKKSLGVIEFVKHHYCCFSNILEKVVQVQGRKQLGLNFGSGGSPNCRGFTLDELARIDFSKIDFAEVAAEMQKKIVMPKTGDVKTRINNSFDNATKFNQNQAAHPSNKAAGVNSKLREEE